MVLSQIFRKKSVDKLLNIFSFLKENEMEYFIWILMQYVTYLETQYVSYLSLNDVLPMNVRR